MKASDIYRECVGLLGSECRVSDVEDLPGAQTALAAALVTRLSRGQKVDIVLRRISDVHSVGDVAVREGISVGLIPSIVAYADAKFVRGSAAFSRHEETIKNLLSAELRREWDHWTMLEDPEEPNQSSQPTPSGRG